MFLHCSECGVTKSSSMELLSAKIIASLLLGAISLLLGIVPVILKRFKVIGQNSNSKNGKFILAALSCFGGGVILATCFTHMLPEVNVAMRRSIQKGTFPDSGNYILMFFYSNFFQQFIFTSIY